MATTSAQGFAPMLRTFSNQTIKSEYDRERNLYDIGRDDGKRSRQEPSKAENWKLMPDIQSFSAQADEDGRGKQRLGVTWNNLQAKGYSSDHVFTENVLSQFNIPRLIQEGRHGAPLKTIIEDSSGCLLSNRRNGYAEINGDVHYGSMDHVQAQNYSGQIAMNTEDELFFPTLTVGQTMDFATRMKVPARLPSNMKSSRQFQEEFRDFLLKSMGIEHTHDTKIGDAFTRGVSGGERKRVSIIECLATRGSVMCWDNSTRGLDASTALEYTRAIRAMTDVMGVATVVTLYQAGNGIYNLFDKVLLLDEGKQLYYGPAQEARSFMEDLGFFCQDGANVADYLTGVMVPTERIIKEGYEHRFPRTADGIQQEYLKSPTKAAMEQDSDFPKRPETEKATNEFRQTVASDRQKRLPKNSSLTVSFANQVRACMTRQYQILLGDKATFFIKQGSTLVQALIAGSLFYNAPNNSSGLFIKGGAIFFSLLFNSLLSMAEVMDSFTGRPILSKHKAFAFHHPAAFCIAQIAADIPVAIFQISIFSLVLYFMTGLTATAGAFFTFWIIVFTVTLCMTALFRAVGAAFSTFDAASKVSGFLISALILYTGYMVNKMKMHPWFGWIFWIDPLAYGFESLLANEFHGKTIDCVNNNLVPNGPSYTSLAQQACAGVGGARLGATSISGDDYLSSLEYSYSHLWRNFGIIWAWWALFVGITIFFTSRWRDTSSGGGMLLIPRDKAKKNKTLMNDEEKQMSEERLPSASNSQFSEDTKVAETSLVRNTSVFTWKNLSYTVKTPSGDRLLLDNVQGYVKPGMLGALMGSSGAGKTTLLDVLAQRKTEGTITGSILVDGRPLGVSFQRSAGYCEQMDVHEPVATVREALEFSALLRQSRDTPKEEKLRYVDTIIDLLEMRDIEHTLVGQVGAGLSVEQRKRLTIGVELVSKPSILIFLDEPTSGLDGQSAFNVLRFLKKLAAVGQAVLVTIHQPSASLFTQFDTLLLLARGGKTVYFGDIGENASILKKYFAAHGAPCPHGANPAEHMIDVVSGSLAQDKDWNKIWLESDQCAQVSKELDYIIEDAASKAPGTKDDGFEFGTSMWTQTKLVTQRMNLSLYRNTDYVNNKLALHIFSALFVGFSFWKVGNGVQDLQLCLFAIFNFIFVAPGVIAQLQPLFIDRRDIYETREKKSKMYSWSAFVTGSIVSEIPYLCICAVLYFACWYYTVGFPTDSNKAGATFFVMLMYESVYTGIGQFIAAYAPNAVFASLVNPLFLGILISFCGVLVPYAQLNVFWRYWIYYLNPFNYLMGSMLTFTIFDRQIQCTEQELAIFDPPVGQTCKTYLTDFMQGTGARSNLLNPDATSGCQVCQYTRGSDYLYGLNLLDYNYGWRDAVIVVIFALSSYGLVYALMKLRTKASKKAE